MRKIRLTKWNYIIFVAMWFLYIISKIFGTESRLESKALMALIFLTIVYAVVFLLGFKKEDE